MPRFRKLACLTGALLAVSSSATPPIFAPVKVGRPPANAFVGLSLLPDGEIRHYNYQGVPHDGIEPHGPPLGRVYSYISSRDGGLTWTDHVPQEPILGADVRSPVSGEYLRIFSDAAGTFVLKSSGGPDGKWSRRKIDDRRFIMVKPPVFIRGGRRAVVCMHSLTGTVTFYTDDDGESWSISN
ncbi:MAG: hypothetical protein SynsKO_31260 [Synoicihabitans sp.]